MVGADNEIWHRRTCQAVQRERVRGVRPPCHGTPAESLPDRGHLKEYPRARPTRANSELHGISDTGAQGHALHLLGDPAPHLRPRAEPASQRLLLRLDPWTRERNLCPQWLTGLAGTASNEGMSTLPQPLTSCVNCAAEETDRNPLPCLNPALPLHETQPSLLA